MDRKYRIFFICIVLVLYSAACLKDRAGASTVEFPLDVEYSGGSGSEGLMPWATATFVTTGSKRVTLTMSAENLVSSEFISLWYFNFDPILDPTLLIFSPVGIPGAMPKSINTGMDAFKAGPDRFYDIEFSFPTSAGNSSNRFTAGETVVYDITYAGPGTISTSSFVFESLSGKQGSFHSAAHIQSIGTGGKSGWVGNTSVVPEPVSSLLFLTGGAVLGYGKYRKARSA
ncbi:MAG: hypothetical protein JSU90_08910 [Nitrospiraceae bacterium]|nr:MAG: hypothetical protein JSU90_08910 [Nitrospiraceae bacterium]